MNKDILNYQFSLFGKYDDFYNNIGNYLSEFNKFNKDILNDVLPNGNSLPCYKFNFDNISILVHFDRIDIILTEKNEEDCKNLKEYFSLIGEKMDLINRLAINYSYFYEDKDLKILNKIASSDLLFNDFNNLEEYFFRKNNIFLESINIFLLP